jgi:hypothetical protein
MNVCIRLSALLVILTSLSIPVFAHQRTWPGKRLAEALSEAKNFSQKQATLGSAQVDSIQKTLGDSIRTEDKTPNFFVGVGADGRSLGVVLFIDATGQNGKIEMGVAISPTGSVIRVVLFDNSENADLGKPKFLSQFAGKKPSDKFKLGEDVVAEKGSEKGAEAIAKGVLRALLIAKAALNLGGK